MRDTKRTRAVTPLARPLSYTATKAQWEAVIAQWAERSFGTPRGFPVRIMFIWREPDAHRDPDGISSGGRKLVLDGLVKAGVLPTDTHRHVCGFEDLYDTTSGQVGVTVTFPGSGQAATFGYRLPDLNELLALREASARRSVKRSLRGRLA